MSDYSPEFPQYLSSPTQILWWEFDQLAIAMLSFMVALLQGGWLMWVTFCLVQFFYARAKKNRPRGFMQHIIYMFGLSNINNYPEYFEQVFNE